MSIILICECGKQIEGITQNQAEYLLKQHKLGWRHKEAMAKKNAAIDQSSALPELGKKALEGWEESNKKDEGNEPKI